MISKMHIWKQSMIKTLKALRKPQRENYNIPPKAFGISRLQRTKVTETTGKLWCCALCGTMAVLFHHCFCAEKLRISRVTIGKRLLSIWEMSSFPASFCMLFPRFVFYELMIEQRGKMTQHITMQHSILVIKLEAFRYCAPVALS